MPRLLTALFLAATFASSAAYTGDQAIGETLIQSLTAKGKVWTLSPENLLARVATAPKNQVWNLREWEHVSLTAQRSDKTLGGLRLRWIVTSRIGGTYQSIQAAVVSNAAPSTVSLAFSPASSALIPAGHQRPWDSLAASQVLSIELRPECTFSSAGNAPMELTVTKLLLKPAVATNAATLKNVQLFTAPPAYNAEAELRFQIHPMPADPFAVDAEGDVRVIAAQKKPLLAFIDQNFHSSQKAPTSEPSPRATRFSESSSPPFRPLEQSRSQTERRRGLCRSRRCSLLKNPRQRSPNF